MKFSINMIYVICGWTSLALGFIGIFLPLLPTTPFVLLSAFCFSKGSPRVHQWLVNNKTMGPIIVDWNTHRVISGRTKIISTATIVPLFTYTLIAVKVGWWIKMIVVAIGIGVLTFIWRQKSARKLSGLE